MEDAEGTLAEVVLVHRSASGEVAAPRVPWPALQVRPRGGRITLLEGHVSPEFPCESLQRKGGGLARWQTLLQWETVGLGLVMGTRLAAASFLWTPALTSGKGLGLCF